MAPLTIAAHRELLTIMGAPVTEQIVIGWMIRHPADVDAFELTADCFVCPVRQCIWRGLLTLREADGSGYPLALEAVELASTTVSGDPPARCALWRELQLCHEAGELPHGPVADGAAWLREIARRRRLQAVLVDALEHVAARTAEDTCVLLATAIDDITEC